MKSILTPFQKEVRKYMTNNERCFPSDQTFLQIWYALFHFGCIDYAMLPSRIAHEIASYLRWVLTQPELNRS